MEKRWASVKLTLVLMYFGILPVDVDASLLVVLALLGLAIALVGPLFVRCGRCVWVRAAIRVPVSTVRTASPDHAPLIRPLAPGTPGTVRTRAPGGGLALHGRLSPV